MARDAAEDTRPVYTVIAGPNGSGKSTLVERAERDGYDIGPFINPDVIAKALPPGTKAPELAAGREALRQSATHMAAGQSFSRESTLTSHEIMKSMETAKGAGFRVDVKFVAVTDVEESIERVKHRVEQGGHDIPEETQRRRFDKSIENAAKAARVADTMSVYENPRGGSHRVVAVIVAGKVTRLESERPPWADRIVDGLDRVRAGRQAGPGLPRSAERTEERTPPGRAESGDELGL